jgi:uncharacterized delta-60 repeat protein
MADGSYEYAGVNPTVPWSALSAFPPGMGMPVRLRVTDTSGMNGLGTATITVMPANHAPVAAAGGPYGINEGDPVVLDASASSDPDGDALSFAWDLDGDGQYDDVAGVSPSLTWAELVGLGIADDGSFSFGLQVDDGHGGQAEAFTVLTVNNAAPTIALTGAAEVDEGAAYALTLGPVSDPGDDSVSSLTVNWGDGTATGRTAGQVALDPMVIHTYASGPAAHTITVDLTDEDGTHSVAGSLGVTVNHVGSTAGALDPTFGSGAGLVLTDFGLGDDEARAVAIQPDGKIVVAGISRPPGGDPDIAVSRYNADGSLDTAFGTGGRVTVDFGPYPSVANAVAIQADGKIVVAGSALGWYLGHLDSAMAVVRYNSDGTLDPT